MDKYNINQEWNIWYHSIIDNNWDKKSYQKLITLRNLLDYQLIKDTFEQNHYQNGMFFCMKGNIAPLWEDPENRNGGCLSFKASSINIMNDWNDILFKCINESILLDKNNSINGISISPKKEFNIIKIWFKDNNYDKVYKPLFEEFNNSFVLSNAMYKKHDF
tara:strand:+ start:361 stop:846 length:486 start_codon:yes stop_codon:yes gene_type:complete